MVVVHFEKKAYLQAMSYLKRTYDAHYLCICRVILTIITKLQKHIVGWTE